MTHNPRASVTSISIFFLLGSVMLSKVNVAAGAKIAADEEAQAAD